MAAPRRLGLAALVVAALAGPGRRPAAAVPDPDPRVRSWRVAFDRAISGEVTAALYDPQLRRFLEAPVVFQRDEFTYGGLVVYAGDRLEARPNGWVKLTPCALLIFPKKGDQVDFSQGKCRVGDYYWFQLPEGPAVLNAKLMSRAEFRSAESSLMDETTYRRGK